MEDQDNLTRHSPSLAIRTYRSKQRWIILFLSIVITFGIVYSFDNPEPLQDQLMEQLHLEEFGFNLLYSMYSMPNIIIPFFGGIMIDYLGARQSIIIFIIIASFGQLLFTISGYVLQFWLMIVSRIVFGIGAECLEASIQTLVTTWFKYKEISLALGFCMCLPRLGSSLNSIVSPKIYNKTHSIGHCFLIGFIFTLIGIVCSIIMVIIDKKARQKNPPPPQQQNQLPQLQKCESSSQILRTSYYSDMNKSQVVQEQVNFSQIKDFTNVFWLVITISALGEVLIIAFLDDANQFFQERYGYKESQAGKLLTIPYLISALFVILLVIVGEKLINKRSVWIIVSCFMYVITHVLIYYLTCEKKCLLAIIPVIMLGLSFSLYSIVIIPSVSFVADMNLLGTAFGLQGSFQNLALCIFPMISGLFFEEEEQLSTGKTLKNKDFQASGAQSLFYIFMSIVALIVAIVLYFKDKNKDKQLLDCTNVKSEQTIINLIKLNKC